MLSLLPEYRRLEGLKKDHLLPAAVFGLLPVHQAQLIASLTEGRTALVLAPDEPMARRLCEDINTFVGGRVAQFYPYRDFVFLEVQGASREYEHARLSVLGSVLQRHCRIVVTSIDAALQKTIPPQVYAQNCLTLKTGETWEVTDLTQKLVQAGYVARPQVDGICQFSHRGGILDIFPPSSFYPLRIEFFDNEIDSIATFDQETQRRLEIVDEMVVTPGSEVLVENPGELIEQLKKLQKKYHNKGEKQVTQLTQDIELLQNGTLPQGLDRYLPLCYPNGASLFDYFSDGLVFVCDYTALRQTAQSQFDQFTEDVKLLLESGMPMQEMGEYLLDSYAFSRCLQEGETFLLENFTKTLPEINIRGMVNINAVSRSQWAGDMASLLDDLEEYQHSQYAVGILCATEKGAKTLVGDLLSRGD